MKHRVLGRHFDVTGIAQSVEHEFIGHASCEAVAEHLAGAEDDDHGQVQPALPGRYAGGVTCLRGHARVDVEATLQSAIESFANGSRRTSSRLPGEERRGFFKYVTLHVQRGVLGAQARVLRLDFPDRLAPGITERLPIVIQRVLTMSIPFYLRSVKTRVTSIRFFAGHAIAHTAVNLVPAYPFLQRLRHAAELRGDGLDDCRKRRVLPAVLMPLMHGEFTDLRGKRVQLVNGYIFSTVGVSINSGAVELSAG